jgi:ribosome-binding protein aMBF1 (putative translation factor)
MSLPHQDWEPVILKKRPPPAKPKQPTYTDQQSKKLESDEINEIKYFDREFCQKVQKARLERKLTQKQLANQMNYREEVIKELEQGKLKYDPQLKVKLMRFFGFRKQ